MQVPRIKVIAHARSIAIAALGALAFCVAAQSASAVSFSVEGAPRAIAMASNGMITFSAGGFFTVECNLTFNGTIQGGLIEKTVGTQFGQITSGSIGICLSGAIVALLTPIPIRYRAILGTLPSAVTGIEFALLEGITYQNGSVTCLYRGEIFELSAVRGSNPYTTTGNVSITGDNIGGGSGFCALLNGDQQGRWVAFTPALVIRRL